MLYIQYIYYFNVYIIYIYVSDIVIMKAIRFIILYIEHISLY